MSSTEQDALYVQYFKEEADKILQESIDPQSLPAHKFVKGLHVYPYGVLGGSIRDEYEEEVHVGSRPAAYCVIVDPCSVHHISSPHGPQLAHGLSGSIYRHLNIANDEHFPSEVISSVVANGDAKYFHYHHSGHVIHCAEPNFSQLEKNNKSRQKIIEMLGCAYANIFREFLVSGKKALRLCPLSTKKKLSGIYKVVMSRLTYEAIIFAFKSLDQSQQDKLLDDSGISLCIYNQKDFKSFVAAGFNYDKRSLHDKKQKSIFKELEIGQNESHHHHHGDGGASLGGRGINKPIHLKVSAFLIFFFFKCVFT
jgi:hypothetical protein